MRQTRRARLKARLRTARAALAATFRLRNLRRARRSVTHGVREYLCFYLTMLVIGTGFAVIALSADAELEHTRRQIEENYDYHIEIGGMTEEQMTAVNNRFYVELEKEVPWLDKVRIREETDGSYTCFVTAPDGFDPAETLAYVRTDILRQTAGEYRISTSPLYEYGSAYKAPLLWERWGLTLAWILVSVLALSVLLRIRLEHFRFIYGIYTTCGADYPMLFGAMAGDMLVVALFCAPLAVLLGVGGTALLCLPRGLTLHLSVRTVLTLPLLWILTVLVAVCRPVRRLSHRTPIWMLTGQDLSGLVSSPRRSLRLFGASFPGRYELFTFWRMRKYYAGLILSAVLFAALFVSGLYIARIQEAGAEVPAYEYIISYPATADAESETGEDGGVILPTVDADTAAMLRSDGDVFIPSVAGLPSVSYVWWQAECRAGTCMSHLLIRPEHTGRVAGSYAVSSDERASDGYTFAIQNYTYVAVDDLWLETVTENGLGTVEGDPSAVLTDPHSIIVTEDIYNQSAYSFSPGDKVVVATLLKQNSALSAVADERAALRQQIAGCSFTYEEYTVCAVVRGMTSRDSILFGVGYDTFETLTGKPAVRDTLYVYMDSEASFEEVRSAESAVRREVSYFSGWTVSRTGNYFRARVQNGRGTPDVIRWLSVLTLAVSPAVWLFSQIMFYRKRRGELSLLRALGARRGRIACLFPLAGSVLSALASLVTVVLVSLCNRAVYLLIAVLLPKLHLTDAFPYAYSLSLPALLLCVGISLVCGFLSCVVSGWLLRRTEASDRETPGNLLS